MTSLTGQVGLRIGPLLVETLFKHYLEKKTVTKDSKAREELLYDAAFTAFKTFLEAATKHSVEEIQEFSNTRLPSPPWVHCVRLRIPLSCCNDAASYLIAALGGEEATRAFTGGIKWWQARGVQGVDAQWVCSKKDLEAGERKLKESRKEGDVAADGAAEDGDPVYSSGMDGMRCLMYMHGGGYYFGSVDQERYCMQRYARKMKGRVFAVDYRLAPQYPFPCAIHDCIAAYLYLIRPPPGVSHAPIPPDRIIFGGDSAGGGLALALLQVIRDTGLPMPAGAVLISPWGDLTHSFPSVMENTATDIVPPYGLSIHKPSTLWPPPSEDISLRVRDRLRERIKSIMRPHAYHEEPSSSKEPTHFTQADEGKNSELHTTTSRGDTNLPPDPSDGGEKATLHPTLDTSVDDETPVPGKEEPPAKAQSIAEPSKPGPITLTVDGQEVTIRSQVQLYATNHQLTHPLVSPALGYLGGLCPLFVIASNNEVLRDEIIYIAHKAARPTLYPVKEETRRLYPHLKGIEERFGPTQVHLQVYDDTSHVLPLFSFTTPAKYCYRAIAAFCVHVTQSHVPRSNTTFSAIDSPLPTSDTINASGGPGNLTIKTDTETPRTPQILDSPLATTPEEEKPWLDFKDGTREGKENEVDLASPKVRFAHVSNSSSVDPAPLMAASSTQAQPDVLHSNPASPETPAVDDQSKSPRPRLGNPSGKTERSLRSFSFPAHLLRSRSMSQANGRVEDSNSESKPSLRKESQEASEDVAGPRFGWNKEDPVGRKAGDASLYSTALGSPFEDNMIRERVSTTGTIRPLEPPEDLPALQVPLAEIGVIKEAAAKRYLHGQALWDRKFGSTMQKVQQQRVKHLKGAKKEADKSTTVLSTALSFADVGEKMVDKAREGSWGWGWALEGEDPPPTSIVARRDTGEARRLAQIADRSWEGGDEDKWGGNRLWSQLADFLTNPTTEKREDGDDSDEDGEGLRRRDTVATSHGRERKGTLGILRRFSRKSRDNAPDYRSDA